MAKKLEDLLNRIERPLTETMRNLPPILGEEVVNFAHESFDRQACSKW